MYIHLAWGYLYVHYSRHSYIQFKVLKVVFGDEIYPHMNSEGHGAKIEILWLVQQGSAINIPGGRPANISSQHRSESDAL